VPHDGEDYVHRIGRTARAETDGTAFTFVTEKEQGKMARIEQLIGREVPLAQVPPELGAVPDYRPKERRPAGGEGGNRGKGKPQAGHRKPGAAKSEQTGRSAEPRQKSDRTAAPPPAQTDQPKRGPIKIEKRPPTPPTE